MTDTANAPERIWTADTTGNCSVGFNTPSLYYKNEYISRTHCDELVAAAWIDIADTIASINGVLDDPTLAKIVSQLRAKTPDDARTALTAYGERMKAEGAREAQAKIARLTNALEEIADRHIPDQPAALDISEAEYVRRQHTELRRTARATLAEVRRFAGAALQENSNG